jgi:hypothetical protein
LHIYHKTVPVASEPILPEPAAAGPTDPDSVACQGVSPDQATPVMRIHVVPARIIFVTGKLLICSVEFTVVVQYGF